MIQLDLKHVKSVAQRDFYDYTEMFNLFLVSLNNFIQFKEAEGGLDSNSWAMMHLRDRMIQDIYALRAMLNYERENSNGVTEKTDGR
jgi:hypothetical protein